MKIGSTFLMATAVLSALALTTGCVTTESQGSGRGAGAKTRGFYKADHKGKSSADEGMAVATEPYEAYEDDGTMMMEEDSYSSSESYVEPSQGSASYGETEIYIVQKGDVLSQLAVDFDTTTATLVDMNGLSNPDVLYVGQEIRVPAGRGGSKTTTKPTGTIKAGGTYTIQKGDTLSEIALAAGVTIDDLRAVNGLKGDNIMAGEELNIPAYGKVPSSSKRSSGSSSSSAKSAEPAPQDTPAVEPEMAPPVLEPVATETVDINSIVVEEVLYPGETLEGKARQYGVSVAEIMRINGITDVSQVREGQTIRIPVAE